jgi:molecular chaperone GrpE
MENCSETGKCESCGDENSASDAENLSEELKTDAECENSAKTNPCACADGEKTVDLETENAQLRDQFLRKAADFENYRKRSIKEKQEAIDYANQNLLLDIIPIFDDFDRALAAADKAEKSAQDFDTLKEGVKIAQQRLYSTLENKWALKRFDSAGLPFDPERHEALAMVNADSDDVKEATVQDDFMKGYTLKDRVIRTAKVKVVMPVKKGDG